MENNILGRISWDTGSTWSKRETHEYNSLGSKIGMKDNKSWWKQMSDRSNEAKRDRG